MPEIVGDKGECEIIDRVYGLRPERYRGDVPCLEVPAFQPDWLDIGVPVLGEYPDIQELVIDVCPLWREYGLGNELSVLYCLFRGKCDGCLCIGEGCAAVRHIDIHRSGYALRH